MPQLLVVLLFMLILPVISIVWDMVFRAADLMASVGKWFVHWGAGWRLVAAGAHQLLKPSFTAKDIFEINDPRANKLALEIGFGNLAIGTTAIASLYFPEWIDGLARAGAIFYTLAGNNM